MHQPYCVVTLNRSIPSDVGSEERALLESVSNHVNARAAGPRVAQPTLLSEQ
jgi:hypothetical protein